MKKLHVFKSQVNKNHNNEETACDPPRNEKHNQEGSRNRILAWNEQRYPIIHRKL